MLSPKKYSPTVSGRSSFHFLGYDFGEHKVIADLRGVISTFGCIISFFLLCFCLYLILVILFENVYPLSIIKNIPVGRYLNMQSNDKSVQTRKRLERFLQVRAVATKKSFL